MPNCSFYSCQNNSKKNPELKWAKFVAQKRDPERYEKWYQRLKRVDLVVTRNTYICEEHFPEGTADLNYWTNPDLIPDFEANPETFTVKSLRPRPKRPVNEVTILEEKLQPKIRKETSYPKSVPQNSKLQPKIHAETSKSKVVKNVPKKVRWRCECSYTDLTKAILLKHIKRTHPDKKISDQWKVEIEDDRILYSLKLDTKELPAIHQVVVLPNRTFQEPLPESILSDIIEDPLCIDDIT